jgi:tetratricopeptide (TPR) repeat protein
MNMLMSVSPDTQQGRDVKVVQALEVAAKQLDDPQRKWHPEVEAYLRNTIGTAYRVLGEPKLAEPNLRKAAEMLAKIRGADHVEAHHFRGEWAKSLGAIGERERSSQVLAETVRALGRISGPDDGMVLSFLDDWAQSLLEQGRLDEAEPAVRRLLETYRRLHGPEDDRTLGAVNTYAGLLFERGEYALALEQFRALADARLKLHGPDHALTLVVRQNLASLLFRTGKTTEAAELMEKVVDAQQRAVGAEHSRTLDAMINLAQMKQSLSESDEAIGLLERVVEVRRRKLGVEHPDTLRAMANLGNILSADDTRFAEAEPTLREVLDVSARVPPADPSLRLLAQTSLAKVLAKLGKPADAEPLYREALDAAVRTLGPEHPVTGSYHLSYGAFLFDEKQYDRAEEQLVIAQRIASNAKTPNAPREVLALNRLIKIAEARGDTDKAAQYNARLAQVRPQPTTRE